MLFCCTYSSEFYYNELYTNANPFFNIVRTFPGTSLKGFHIWSIAQKFFIDELLVTEILKTLYVKRRINSIQVDALNQSEENVLRWFKNFCTTFLYIISLLLSFDRIS